MPQSNDEVKARLMREIEELVNKLLAEKRPAEEISLSNIEQAAVETGLRFRRAVTRLYSFHLAVFDQAAALVSSDARMGSIFLRSGPGYPT